MARDTRFIDNFTMQEHLRPTDLFRVRTLSRVPNGVVVHTDGRRFPGLVVQGDRLREWSRLAQAGQPDAFEMLAEDLEDSVRWYDSVSSTHHLAMTEAGLYPSPALTPGMVYEDCAYHPVLCTDIDSDGCVSGISLLDASAPRSCDLVHCGVVRLTLEEVAEARADFEAWVAKRTVHWSDAAHREATDEIAPEPADWSRRWIDYQCDANHAWTVELSPGEPEPTHQLCPADGAEPVTAALRHAADRVDIAFISAARENRALDGERIEQDQRYVMEMSSPTSMQVLRSARHLPSADALRVAGELTGVPWEQALQRWSRMGLST